MKYFPEICAVIGMALMIFGVIRNYKDSKKQQP